MLKRTTIIAALISIAAVVLHFYGIVRNDVQHDFALNSARALGWFDFIAGAGQTTPVQWFEQKPWWASLSFHDHPPAAFAIQHVFFRLLGDNQVAARMPYALASLSTILIVYVFLKRLFSDGASLIAALVLTVSSYFLWTSKAGYLEGIEIFFIMLSVMFFLYFVKSGSQRYLYLWASAVGLALMTKYTALFLLPAAVVYLFLYKRSVFKSKNFWLSLLLMVIILSPVIIYNTMVFTTRGHFDAALSSMIGMRPKDYEVLSYRGYDTPIAQNISSTLFTLFENVSLPLFFLVLLSLVYFGLKTLRGRNNEYVNFLFLNVASIFFIFFLPGAEARFFSITTPFLAILISLFLTQMWKNVSFHHRQKNIFSCGVAAILVFELFYSLNTNIFSQPLLHQQLFFSQNRFYNTGFYELGEYIKENIVGDLPARRPKVVFKDLEYHEAKGKDVILIDERIHWFSRVWYFQRYHIYYNIPFAGFNDLDETARRAGLKDIHVMDVLNMIGANSFWVILATDKGVINSQNPDYVAFVEDFEDTLREAGVELEKEFYNSQGEATFRVYQFHFRT